MALCPRRGPQRFASTAEHLSRLAAAFLCVGLAATACSASEGGPLSPRPVPSVATTTSTSVADTTTTAAAVLDTTGHSCETEFCLVYHISPTASWSDGDPITAADFAHTVELHQGLDSMDTTLRYDLIEAIDVIDDMTFQLSFSDSFGAWQTLFDRVYPAGGPAGDVVGLPTSGPFEFVEWTEGDQVSITRDPDWWSPADPISGDPAGDVEEIRFVFIDTLEEMVDALEDGEVDVFSARPDATAVSRLDTMENANFALAPGPFWEHIDFHHEDPMLSQLWLRQVISLAIDREKILDRTVRLLDPTAVPLDNTVFMGNSSGYEAHFHDTHDPDQAERLLVDNGCARGEDGVYECDGTRLSFTWASTNDDPARAEILASVREDLGAVGIEIVADLRSPSDFVTRDFLFGSPDVWQLINFSWRAHPEPTPANTTYYCGSAGGLNVNRYCSEEVEDLIRATETIVQPSDRVETYNMADRLYLDEIAVIPLYQKPVLMAWSTELSGPQPNYGFSSDLWNVASWSGKDAIVVALPAEPTAINPLIRGDESADVILGPLLYGAFGMNPSHEYVPVLVESVEIIEGGG
jgi:peptide/nickel transport system substrate-binding protein